MKKIGITYSTTLLAMCSIACSNVYAQQELPEKTTVKSTIAAPGLVGRTRQALGVELNESLRRAKSRLDEESSTYSEYLEQRMKAEKDGKEQLATDLQVYEMRLLEAERRKIKKNLEERQNFLMTELQAYMKSQQESANADVLAYETARRQQAFQLIGEKEKSVRDEVLAAQSVSESEVHSKVQSQLKAHADGLKNALDKRLQELDSEYLVKGRLVRNVSNSGVTPGGAVVSSVEPVVVRPVPEVPVSAEWEVTAADPTLRHLLTRWAERSKWTLVWDSDIDLPLNGNAVFKSTLAKAVESVIETMISEKDRMTVSLFEKNKVIRVQRRY